LAQVWLTSWFEAMAQEVKAGLVHFITFILLTLPDRCDCTANVTCSKCGEFCASYRPSSVACEICEACPVPKGGDVAAAMLGAPGTNTCPEGWGHFLSLADCIAYFGNGSASPYTSNQTESNFGGAEGCYWGVATGSVGFNEQKRAGMEASRYHRPICRCASADGCGAIVSDCVMSCWKSRPCSRTVTKIVVWKGGGTTFHFQLTFDGPAPPFNASGAAAMNTSGAPFKILCRKGGGSSWVDLMSTARWSGERFGSTLTGTVKEIIQDSDSCMGGDVNSVHVVRFSFARHVWGLAADLVEFDTETFLSSSLISLAQSTHGQNHRIDAPGCPRPPRLPRATSLSVRMLPGLTTLIVLACLSSLVSARQQLSLSKDNFG